MKAKLTNEPKMIHLVLTEEIGWNDLSVIESGAGKLVRSQLQADSKSAIFIDLTRATYSDRNSQELFPALRQALISLQGKAIRDGVQVIIVDKRAGFGDISNRENAALLTGNPFRSRMEHLIRLKTQLATLSGYKHKLEEAVHQSQAAAGNTIKDLRRRNKELASGVAELESRVRKRLKAREQFAISELFKHKRAETCELLVEVMRQKGILPVI